MKMMPVGFLTAGMLVARDVISEQGMFLLNSGTCLTQVHIVNLQKRDVPFVYVEEDAEDVE